MPKYYLHLHRLITSLAAIGFLSWLLCIKAYAQDTLTVMQYNLTNYGNLNIPGCTAAINGVAIKDPYLTTILSYTRPDIFGVNEMVRFEATADRPKNILNGLGYGVFGRDRLFNNTGSDLVNTLYYNTNKVVLKSHTAINAPVRTIDHYKLYYKAGDLATNPDTAFINILICHLKAGNTASDSSSRRLMADAVVNYLTTNRVRGAVIMQGDFNCYSASEPAMTRLMARNTWGPVRLSDPLNALGSWTSNQNFAQYHTQSSVVTSNGCLSGGGLDDRFDIFLANQYLLRDSNGVSIVPNSYKAIGNNGRVYNNTVNVSGNNSAPANVLSAMVNFSDHLPIVLKLRVNRPVITSLDSKSVVLTPSLRYNVATQLINGTIPAALDQQLTITLCNSAGQVLRVAKSEETAGNQVTFRVGDLPTGAYWVQISGSTNLIKPTKLFIW